MFVTPTSPRLAERERIRLLLRDALVRYDGDDEALRLTVRGMVNFNTPAGESPVVMDVRRAIHRQ